MLAPNCQNSVPLYKNFVKQNVCIAMINVGDLVFPPIFAVSQLTLILDLSVEQ